MTFERVYSVTDFWDGPRAGVANYMGEPHGYRSVWRDDASDWDDDRYFLYPISAEEAAWEAESWAIWQRFASHYKGKKAPVPENLAEWGALPQDTDRQLILQANLARVHDVAQEQCFVVAGQFRALEKSPLRLVAPRLEVEWRPAAARDGDRLLPLPAI